MALKEWRCCNCNRILAKMDLSPSSTIQIKCRCGILNTVRTNAKYAMAHMPIINV
ncbi:MAG: Com family DNA-binding transcriptional regulator [Chloroflexi bacterium]|nr:Com family DNA-binding transcriptional regulator [Chloroflexota bacterium]